MGQELRAERGGHPGIGRVGRDLGRHAGPETGTVHDHPPRFRHRPLPAGLRTVHGRAGGDLASAAQDVEQLRAGGADALAVEAPLGLPQVLINGRQDHVIPIPYAEGYARPMRAAGDDVRVRMLDRTGHVELVAPETAAWAAAVEELERALRQ